MKSTLDHINNNSMMCNHSKELTRDTVHHNQSSIGDTQSGRDLRGEVHVAGRVDQVDEETNPILTLLNEGHVIFRQLVVHGDGTVKEINKTLYSGGGDMTKILYHDNNIYHDIVIFFLLKRY